MVRVTPPGTEGYGENAVGLINTWQTLTLNDKPKAILALVPTVPSLVLDVGAGIGTDAGALAALGHRVVAVEPVKEFLAAAKVLQPSPSIDWIDDHLPSLELVRRKTQRFDFILLSAVWMHLDRAERAQAFPRLVDLMAERGRLVLSTRHGPVPPGRRMFEVPEKETLELAANHNLTVLVHLNAPSVQQHNRAAGVAWVHMAFEKSRQSSSP